MLEPEYLQTLFNVNESYVDLTSFWLSKAKYLNVLHLGRWQGSSKNHIEVTNTEFLRTLGDLKHLRYINLQGISRIHELPLLISSLRHLKILDLRACHNLEKLPSGISMLENLEYLDMSECYLIGNMPVGLAALTKLQVLKGFVIGNPTANGHCKLSQLTKLSNLRKLSLNIYESMADYIAEYELEHLRSFNQLRSLTVAWLGIPPPSKSRKATTRQLRPSLTYSRANTMSQLPPMLEKLDLRCYPYYELPRGLQGMEALKKLYVRGGQLRSLMMTGENGNWATSISILRLKFLIDLELTWPDLCSLFPALVYFEKVNCPKLCLCPCDGRGVWRQNPTASLSQAP
ncbi:disease resistance RPP13-like protein 4 [Carica papaya]|uniref:disease resistance RPP13-like protein 4 n=1 Tax=Carica papaya TaxID=3649 RepID=UPI000B8CB377|nr:disease resistance RPP13-like protein 4 [Carica papaya]